jgi:hypothetical protein
MKGAAALAVAGLVLAPTLAVAAGKPRPAAVSFSFDRISAFTPAGADPRLAATFAARTPSISDFKFTPAAAKGRPSQIRVAVRAGSATRGATLASASPLAPTSYNLGVAVGWKRFAVAGDVATISSPDSAIGKRESAVVGVSYNLNKFSGRVAVGAERGESRVAALAEPDRYSVDVGGAYNLSRRIALTGGVRYRVDKDRLSPVADQRRDSQAVYVGTAFKF